MNIVLFTPERSEAATLRHWCEHEARRLALAVAWQRYGEEDAFRELSTTLAWHAERARMRKVSCRQLAESMLADALSALDNKYNAVLQQMIDAAERELTNNRRSVQPAAHAAADIAREAGVPPSLIESAVRIARWRTRRRA